MAGSMIARREMIGLVLGGGAALLGGCTLIGLQWRYRYQMTVEVDCNGIHRTGSSVIEVVRTWGPTGIGGEARGEAAVVDIAPGQSLFALLRGNLGGADWPFTVPHWAYAHELGGTDMVDRTKLDRLMQLKGVTSELSFDQFPTLVTFHNLNDSKSVVAVDPDDLAAPFGAGVKLRRIAISITDDPVTTGIEKRLGWLGDYPESRLDHDYRGSTNPNLAQKLSNGDFRQGVK